MLIQSWRRQCLPVKTTPFLPKSAPQSFDLFCKSWSHVFIFAFQVLFSIILQIWYPLSSSPYSPFHSDAPFVNSVLSPCVKWKAGTPRCKLPSLQWLEKSTKQFPHHFSVGSIATVAKPCRDLKRKVKPPLNRQPDSMEEIRREESSEREGERHYRGSHLTSSQSHPDYCYCHRF